MPHLTSCAAVGQDAAGVTTPLHVFAAAEDLDTVIPSASSVGSVMLALIQVGALFMLDQAVVEHEERLDGLRVALAPECCKLSTLLLSSLAVPRERWRSFSCI